MHSRFMRPRCRWLAAIAVLAGALVPAGAAAAAPAYNGHRLYAVQADIQTGTLVPFDVDAAGALHERQDQAVTVPGDTTGLVVDREARSLFVSSRETIDFSTFTFTPGMIEVFTIGSDGSLTPAQVVGDSTFAIMLSPDGSRLFAQQLNGEIDSYPVEADGTLGAVGTQYPFTQPANGLLMSADGAALYMNGQNALGFQWAIGADQSLTSLSPGLWNLPCQALFMGSAVGSHNFDVQCFNGDSYTFSTGADDTLTQSGSVFTGSNGEFGNAEDARGRAFYTGSGSFGIYQLARQADGTLAPFPSPLVAGPGQVQALSADPDGTALTAATGSNGFETYRIAADGSLAAGPAITAVSMSPPQFLVYSPQQSPRAAFAATQTANGATSFAAGASQAHGGSVVSRYDWDFGDGSSLGDGGQSVSHAYARPGDYTATLTVTDSAGCSVAGTHNGSMALCSGSPDAAVSHTVHVGAGAITPLTTAGVTPATRSASELRPTGATAAATMTGRKVLLSWAMPGASGTEAYRIAWSTLHSAHGPGDQLMHHLRISGRTHVLLRVRPHSTLHFAVYAYRANGSLTPGTKTTLRLSR